MKRILCLIFILLVIPFTTKTFAEDVDYEVLYAQAQEADFKFMHDIDPFQDEDMYKYAWSPYILFRTSSTLVFKSSKIPAGYYLLTARKYKDKNWILFKERGKVVYTIPVLKTQVVSPDFYAQNLPKPKKTGWQKAGTKISNGFHKVFQGSKKQEPPKSFIEFSRYEGNLYLLKMYYDNAVYITLFRVE